MTHQKHKEWSVEAIGEKLRGIDRHYIVADEREIANLGAEIAARDKRIHQLDDIVMEKSHAAAAAWDENEALRKCLAEWQRAYAVLCGMKCRFKPRTDWPLPGDFVCSCDPDGATLCAVCGTQVDTTENGGEGSQLSDGRWTCSLDCWNAAVYSKPPSESALSEQTGMTADERDNIG